MGASGGGASSGSAGSGSAPSFDLPLSDAGAGIVSLVPAFSGGSATPTFARATTAYTRLANGVWSLIASGSPRSMYSAAGVYLGYWPEGARANVLGGTDAIVRTMSDVGWVVGATLTVGTSTGVDGVADACALLTGGAVAATNTILFTTVLASAARTYSVRVRRVSGTGAVNITDNNGTNWTAMTLTATEQLFQITRTQANPVVGVQVEGNGDSVAVDFNTIEEASFANPTPIPVNVSKAADVLSYASAGNIGNTTGTAYAEFTCPLGNIAGARILGLTTGSPMFLPAGTNLGLGDSTATRTFNAISLPVASPSKVASAWGAAASMGAKDGVASAGAGFDDNIGIGTAIFIGAYSGAGFSLFGSVKNVRIWPSKFSSGQLGAITA